MLRGLKYIHTGNNTYLKHAAPMLPLLQVLLTTTPSRHYARYTMSAVALLLTVCTHLQQHLQFLSANQQ